MLSKQLYGNLASWVIIQQKVQWVPVPNGMTGEAVDVHLLSFQACLSHFYILQILLLRLQQAIDGTVRLWIFETIEIPYWFA